MPGYDGTGPSGQGTMTGRRMGFCAPAGLSNTIAPGRGLGYGRGRGRCFWPNARVQAGKVNATTQKNYLQNMVVYFQDELNTVKEELNRLEKKADKDLE
ncbi:MAG: hypothetical protein CVU87_06800 [Firmicutes bacterium HGW-Firmicutes-12]|jgi:hypothetical protein|nr:MAG: hypothetical protein CVU87_06800 [Firmicutes bacterium HGW-Firmicutes-12]